MYDLGAVARIKYNQGRTTKKSQKRNISHIWGKAPRKDIAMKFAARVDVHEVVTRAEFDLEILRGVNFKFYKGLKFRLLHRLCYCATCDFIFFPEIITFHFFSY